MKNLISNLSDECENARNRDKKRIALNQTKWFANNTYKRYNNRIYYYISEAISNDWVTRTRKKGREGKREKEIISYGFVMFAR